MQIYFKTRQASRDFAAKVKANGAPAIVVDAGKGWGMLRYGVALTGIKPTLQNKACNAVPVRL